MGLRKRVARTAAAAALLAALATLGVGVRPQDHLAHAQGGRVIFNVDTTADTVDADPGNGTCADADGYCSLRAAIMEANAQAAQDASKEFVISLQSAAVYTLARDEDGSGHVVDSGADNDDLDIAANITIEGNGSTIQRSALYPCNLDGTAAVGEFRLFQTLSAFVTVKFKDVTLRNGCAGYRFEDHRRGGGIYADSRVRGNSINLILENTTVENNVGAGVFLTTINGTLTIISSKIRANDHGGIDGPDAGGINVSASNTIIRNSIIEDNLGRRGGGISHAGGNATVVGSVITGNRATRDGGGVWTQAHLTIHNSTVSGNIAGSTGGAISAPDSSVRITLTFATLANNRAEAPTGASGIHLGWNTVLSLKNTILANDLSNGAPNCVLGQGFPTVTVAGVNFATDQSCGQDLTVVTVDDLKLGPLANNGGPTDTHALLEGSVAIDAVPQNECTDQNGSPVPVDQRGTRRPQGRACDAGAYEREQGTAPPTLTVQGAGTGSGTVTSDGIDCTISSGSASGDCTEVYSHGTVVTLTAQPASGSTFAGWEGDCSGASPSVTVTMDGDKTCTARFEIVIAPPPPPPPPPPGLPFIEVSVPSPTGTGELIFHASLMGGPLFLQVAPYTGTPPVPPPAGYELPHGLYSLSVEGIPPGARVTIRVTLPSPAPIGTVWLKLIGNSWVALPVGDDDGDNVITITLIDGGEGDADGVANGVIIDPGGPAIPLRVVALWGDVDCDGKVDAVDALKVLRHVVGLDVSQQEPCADIGSTVSVDGTPRLWGDVDGDGDVDAVDALKLLLHVVGLPVAQAPGTPAIGREVEVSLPRR